MPPKKSDKPSSSAVPAPGDTTAAKGAAKGTADPKATAGKDPKASAADPHASHAGKKPTGWYECGNNYDSNEHTSGEIFKKICDELKSHQLKDEHGHPTGDAPKFLDEDFPTDHCWHAGGHPDALNEVGNAPAKWVRLSDMQSSLNVFGLKPYSQVFQGSRTNGYFIEAMQALAMRPNLVRKLFVRFDTQLGVYIIRLYKNGMWVSVIVDDYIPLDENDVPMCAVNDNFPTICWATILEKAYAKLHHSYEAIGDGGSVSSAMMDLTGGLGGVFHVREIAPDRLFVYLHELQADTLFAARPDTRECARRGVRLLNAPYTIHRSTQNEGRCWVQLCCPSMVGGPFDDIVPSSLLHNPAYPERVTDGCFWISIEDFQNYFSVIFECRLTQARSLDETFVEGMPDVRLLAQRKPLNEKIFACQGLVRAESVPEFHISVDSTQVPCEVYVVLSQIDLRMKKQEHSPQVPMLVTVHEFVSGGALAGYAFVAKSSYEHSRDSAVVFKVTEGGEYLVLVQLPLGSEMEKMIYRVYSTSKITVDVPVNRQHAHKRIVTNDTLAAIPLSLIGRSDDATRPSMFDQEDGEGVHHHEHKKSQEGSSCSLM
jgi:hypothetical protein